MVEREMQELLWLHPDRLLNESLKQFGWETSSDVGRADLVFEDRLGRLLVVEVKRGKLGRGAIDQLLDYFGMMKRRFPNKPVELMVVANSIPPERRLTCENRDIECREISEKTFRELAVEVGYTFISEVNTAPRASSSPAAVHVTAERDGIAHQRSETPYWAYASVTRQSSEVEDFLSRCDNEGKAFFGEFFEAQKRASTQTKITWNHESGFSLHFYFQPTGFAPIVWGFPATNREGRNIQQRLHFPFDFSLKAGVRETFVNEFGAALTAIVPFSGGGKRPIIRIGGLSPAETTQIVNTIFSFAVKASAR